MPGEYPTVTPYLYYEDAAAAMDWLVRVFGFEARMRMENDQGRVSHGELKLGDGLVMIGEPGSGYENPNKRGGRATAGVNVYVDDVDAHFERAKAAGAKINEEPADQDYGDRRYIAEDLEGHDWFFAKRLS
jgi:PhnB protein